ncbi:unnamed protein product [Paramecium octaurelia]|uniref:C3H1-type domain-containing protein n=1 Tax=Paramecium octaurelia TaxID=43137 RepID=A0A8S1TUC4_PAROT|nr:unnamed protein product [Paramecium octaurelia]
MSTVKQTKQVSDILNKIQDFYRTQSLNKTATKKFNISRQTISNKNLYLQQFEKKLEEVTAFNPRKSMVLSKFKEYEQSKQEQNHNKDIATILKEKQKIPKTRICRQYIKTKQCRMGANCKYAHSIKELDIEYAPVAWTVQFNPDLQIKRPKTMGEQRSYRVLQPFQKSMQ